MSNNQTVSWEFYQSALYPFKCQPHENGQTLSNNSLVIADELFESVFDRSVGLALKRISTLHYQSI